MPDLIVRSTRVVTPDGVRPATVHVTGGRIERVAEHDQAGGQVLEAGQAVVMPGLVDTHVHVNEPGRGDWEGFETATRAAAAGGITTLVDMPLNSIPPTTSPGALEEKRAAAGGRCRVDVAFWGGAVPDNLGELAPLIEAGAAGLKAFLVPSGVEEFPHLEPDQLRAAAQAVGELGVPLLVHAELPGPIEQAEVPEDLDSRSYLAYLATRPKEAENLAVELLAEICRETGARLHVVHLASAEALPPLREARRRELPITAETCPHYLFFTSEDVPEGATEFKCAPPIRERQNRDDLWKGLGARGPIGMVVSDHSPSPPELKRFDSGDFLTAWGGISSLQLSLPAVWTASRPRRVGLEELAEWMAAAPARLAGLGGRKGAIAEGLEADLVIWEPEESFLVEPEALEHRHPVTPYADRILYGVVRTTLLRGEVVFQEGRFPGDPAGELLGG